MADLQQIGRAVSTCVYEEHAAGGIVDEIEPFEFEELFSWREGLHTIRKASWVLTEEITKALMHQLRAHEAICMHKQLIARVVAGQLSRRCVDERGLKEYLDLSDNAGLCFRTSDVKLTGLRVLADKKGDDPDLIVDKFFVFEEGPPELKVSTMEYAPHWCLKPPMEHNERRFDPKFAPSEPGPPKELTG